MKCRNFFLGMVAGLCLFTAASSPAQASAPQPQVDGNRIVDKVTGEDFVPRGVNYPSFEYACQQGWGYANDGTNANTAAVMAAWKINTVRLPLNQDCWLGDDGLPATDVTKGLPSLLTTVAYRVAVGKFVEDLNAQGIVVILDLHWSGPDGVVADGLRPMADNRSDDFWYSVSSAFKDNPSVIFDVFNEPHSRWHQGSLKFDLTWNIWKNGGGSAPIENDVFGGNYSGSRYPTTGMSDLVTAVRATGARQPIILSGLAYANDLTGWLSHKPVDNQLIAGFHNYPGNACSGPSCWSDQVSPVASVVPVLTSEFGQNTCDVGDTSHMNTYMRWADNRSIGYLAWAWWRPDDPTRTDCGDWALVEDLNGTPRGTVGTAYRDHLLFVNSHPTTGTPTKPGPDPDPTEPGPGGNSKRGKAKLKIAAPRFSKGILSFRVMAVKGATGKVKVRVYVKNTSGRRTSIGASNRMRTGGAGFSFKVRSDFRPLRIVAKYSGNQKFKSDSTARRIGS